MLMIIFILILMNNNYGQHTINTTNVNDGTNRASKHCCHRESSLQYVQYILSISIYMHKSIYYPIYHLPFLHYQLHIYKWWVPYISHQITHLL
jgi:hypothetical protein